MISPRLKPHSQNYQHKEKQLTQEYCLQEEKLSVLGLRPLERPSRDRGKGRRVVQKEKSEEQKEGKQGEVIDYSVCH